MEWNHHDKLCPYFVAFAALLSPAFLDLLKQDEIQTLNFSCHSSCLILGVRFVVTDLHSIKCWFRTRMEKEIFLLDPERFKRNSVIIQCQSLL